MGATIASTQNERDSTVSVVGQFEGKVDRQLRRLRDRASAGCVGHFMIDAHDSQDALDGRRFALGSDQPVDDVLAGTGHQPIQLRPGQCVVVVDHLVAVGVDSDGDVTQAERSEAHPESFDQCHIVLWVVSRITKRTELATIRTGSDSPRARVAKSLRSPMLWMTQSSTSRASDSFEAA
jgi:hypothetical protein